MKPSYDEQRRHEPRTDRKFREAATDQNIAAEQKEEYTQSQTELQDIAHEHPDNSKKGK